MHRNARVVLLAHILLGAMLFQAGMAQPLNGVWRGKISVPQGIGNRTYQVELKLIRVEDSLRGMAYYYQGGDRYARSLVRGFVDPADGTVRWWDEQMLEGSMPAPANGQITVSADFNCPGEGIMKLDGETSIQNRQPGKTGEVHLDKRSQKSTSNYIEEFYTVIESPEQFKKYIKTACDYFSNPNSHLK